jgi:signal transduction histidine kinase/CheY-like chemotaxis protein
MEERKSTNMGRESAVFSQNNEGVLASEIQAELGQSIQRLIIAHLIMLYVLVLGIDFAPSLPVEPWAEAMVVYYLLYVPFMLFLFLSPRVRPIPSPARRLLAMLADFGFLGLAILTNPTVMMPIYTVIIWVTLGNGLRFGRRYLTIATIIAVITVIVVGFLTYEGEGSQYISIMALLSVLAIPRYASSLLDRIEAARHEAEAANIAKSRFLAQASHDLRQPLHAISLFIVTLQQAGLTPAQRNIVDRIDRSLRGVGRLFRSLLDLSTLDSGSIQPNMAPVALGGLLADLAQQNAELAIWHDCDFRVVETTKTAIADYDLLTTMVQNLLSNAFKFAPGRKIVAGCKRNKMTLSLQIWDQGAGIDPAHLPFLFDEFYQVKDKGDKDHQGVGLGLAIVTRMASLMNLTVSVRSELGRGSCFSIDGLQISAARPVKIAANDSALAASPITGMRILLVEDDPDILAATTELITSWGCKITAMAGVPTYLTDEYDLIIVDFDLGERTTGADCIAAVRWMSAGHTPAIVITAHDENWVTSEIDDPDVLILKKPLRPAELRSAIGASRAKIL